MNRQKLQCALCLLLAVLLGGCQQQPAVSNPSASLQPSLNSGPLISTTAPSIEITTEATNSTEETQPPASLEPVTLLSCVKWRTIPQLLGLGNGAVLSCRNDSEEGKGIVNDLEVIDVYADKVLAQQHNASSRELVEQQFADGHFILKDPATNTFYFYDQNLQITDQFTAVNTDGYFSHDRKNYYFVDNEVLYRMDITSGNYARMTLQYDFRLHSLIGIHPSRNIVVAKCFLSFCNENTGVCAIDCTTGKFLLINQTVSHLWLDGDTFYAAVTNDTVYGSDIVYGSLSDGPTEKASTALLGSDTVSYTILNGSGILLHRTVDENNLSTTVYDLSKGGISSKLAQYDYLTTTLGPVYLKQEQLIFGVYPDDSGFSPVVIDPKSLTYEKSLNLNRESWPSMVDRALVLNYQSEIKGPELPDTLRPLRLKADRLEEKYGISILIGEQTLNLCGSYAAVNQDPVTIDNALTLLEQALAKYPDGFLAQFQNGIREGGLYFCLTGNIQGALNPVGKATKNRNRCELTLDITGQTLERTIHHELWHAIEMRLSTDYFNTAQWQDTNPTGFLYYGHYDSGYQKLTQWTYEQSGDQCHFTDAYAQINPREDRARLMEYIMTEDTSGLLRSDAIRKKLNIMSSAVQEHFNTTGWNTPYWERNL